MPFSTITRESLEILDQNYRTLRVAPGSMTPGRGSAPAPADPTFGCSDDFIRALPFVDIGSSAHPRVYQARVDGVLFEPDVTARSGTSPWISGKAMAPGENFTAAGARMTKIESVVRVDRLMTPEMRLHQTILAKQGLLRALSEALYASDDDNGTVAGLPFYIAPASPQDITYDGARKRRGGFKELIARVRPGGDGLGARANIVATSSRVIWGLVNEIEEKGGTPDFHLSGWTGMDELHYMGVAVVEARVPETPSASGGETVAFAACIQGESGVHMLHEGGDEWGINVGTETLVVQLERGEATGSTSGLSVYGNWALLVPEERSVAVLRHIPLDPNA